MTHDAGYTDAGADYYDRRDQRNREHLARHPQHALTRLGCQVMLLASDGGGAVAQGCAAHLACRIGGRPLAAKRNA
jgi:hypothetical protein